jgi:hypothetical protein
MPNYWSSEQPDSTTYIHASKPQAKSVKWPEQYPPYVQRHIEWRFTAERYGLSHRFDHGKPRQNTWVLGLSRQDSSTWADGSATAVGL